MKTLNIKTIRIDGGTQSRVEINTEIVTEYAEAIKAGAEFPAVVVFNDGSHNWLADGFHRFHAHPQAGRTSIAADVRPGTARDAVLYSLGANGEHGLNRTNADKRKAVETMLKDSEWATWSDRKIAEACGVGHPFVAAIRKPEVAAKQQSSRDSSATKKTKKVESDSTQAEQVTPPVEAQKPQTAPAEDEFTPLDAAHDQIQDLQAELVVARIGSTDSEEATQAATLITELRGEIKLLKSMNRQLTISRDSFQNQAAEMQKQINRQRRELDKVTSLKTA